MYSPETRPATEDRDRNFVDITLTGKTAVADGNSEVTNYSLSVRTQNVKMQTALPQFPRIFVPVTIGYQISGPAGVLLPFG